MTVAAFTAVRCWRRRPGLARPARIFSMRNAVPVTSDRPRAVRRICPPPSPCEPSISSTASSLYADDLAQPVHDIDEILLGLHHVVDGLVRAGSLVDHVRILP